MSDVFEQFNLRVHTADPIGWRMAHILCWVERHDGFLICSDCNQIYWDGRSVMTPEQKRQIDGMCYEEMLRLVRYAPAGHPYFVRDTEVAAHFEARMAELKKTANHVRASKNIGWDGP